MLIGLYLRQKAHPRARFSKCPVVSKFSTEAKPGMGCASVMVARDGIEPPTPAFSGPRSTTELSGLSANFQGATFCAESGVAGEVGEYHERCAQKQPQPVEQLRYFAQNWNTAGKRPARA